MPTVARQRRQRRMPRRFLQPELRATYPSSDHGGGRSIFALNSVDANWSSSSTSLMMRSRHLTQSMQPDLALGRSAADEF
eukprot:5508331-Pyramimonas_sp.AAC.1